MQSCRIGFLVLLLIYALHGMASSSEGYVSSESSDSTTFRLSLKNFESTDSVASAQEFNEQIRSGGNPNWWWTQIRKGTWNIYDTSVQYPGFLEFCVDVYRWVDHAFNSYDPDYIQSPPQKWKVMLKSDSWLDSYAMVFNTDMPVWLRSDMTNNLGAYLQFMAVSVGYAIDLSNIIGNRPALHKKTEFSFSTGRFYLEGQYTSNTEGSVLRRFGPYGKDRFLDMEFPGLDFRSYGVAAYYFLNCHKYSQGATYNFSKIQRRSAGSLIFGFSFTNTDIDVNFSSLPEYMLKELDGFPLTYKFNYNAYSFLIGYGYNWVFARNFVYNITALPGIGWKHCFPQCSGGRRDMWSLDFLGRMGVTYNIDDCFLGLGAKVNGHWFRGNRFNFFNFTLQVAFTAGVRF